MKTIFSFLFCLISSSVVFAQWHPFSNMPPLKFFVQPHFSYGELAQKSASYIGLNAALSWNKNQAIGFTFASNINKTTPEFEIDKSVFLKNTLVGAFYEHTFPISAKFFLLGQITLGAGELYYTYKEIGQHSNLYPYTEKHYFLLKPNLQLEYKISAKIRAQIGGSYLYSPLNFNYRNVKPQHLQTFLIEAGMKYGWFFE